MGVLCQDAIHVVLDAHMEKFGDLLNYDLLVEFVLRTVEFKLSLFFLCDEHISPYVRKALSYFFLKLMVLVMRMVFVMLGAICMLVLLYDLAPLFFAFLKELQEFHHGRFDESVKHISVLDLSRYVRLNGISEALDTLFAHRTDIRKVFLSQLDHVNFHNFT